MEIKRYRDCIVFKGEADGAYYEYRTGGDYIDYDYSSYEECTSGNIAGDMDSVPGAFTQEELAEIAQEMRFSLSARVSDHFYEKNNQDDAKWPHRANYP